LNLQKRIYTTLAEGAGLTVEYKTQDRTDNTGDDKVYTVQLGYEF
jgi:hypothetical protein